MREQLYKENVQTIKNNAEQNKNSKSSKVLKANSLIWTKMIKTIKYHNLNKSRHFFLPL